MRVAYQEMLETFQAILARRGMAEARACAALFADATRDGVATHGVNRFPVFVGQIDLGDVRVNARPVLVQAMGAFERWDGQFGPGNLNAVICMDRAIQLARGAGVGAVALRDTNHWMRGGAYGLRAAAAGCIGICWTNALAAMPAWGGLDARLGTNPLILALPGDPPVLVDMAMSQFSFGKLQEYRLKGQRLPVPGGYDREGALTDDPAAVEATGRVLPAGYWKGSALSMALDMIAAALAGGNSAAELSARFPRETGISQVFIAFAMERLDRGWEATVARIRADVRASAPDPAGSGPRIPGERAARLRAAHDRDGIPVDDRIWEQIRRL